LAENEKGTETLSGTVETVIYKNEANGYTVCDISCDGERVTVVGILPFLNEGESVLVTGRWTYHSSFGKQFKAEHYEKQLPTSKETILAYLSSGAVAGIGPVLAKRIVDKYGEDSLEVLENHPEWLSDISGITTKKALKMNESYREQFGMRNVMMFFNGYFGPATAVKVYKRWGAASVDIIKNNPYILCEQINGIGFDKADNIAKGLGIPADSPFRLASGIKHVLSLEMGGNGNCFLPLSELVGKASQLLCAEKEKINDVIASLTVKKELIAVKFGEETAVYLDYVYNAERYCADKLYELSKTAINVPVAKTESYIADVERDAGITFAEKQREAITKAVTDGLLILTGGPGTGKTTVIKAILKLFDSLEIDTALAAPTGRAAKRMTHSTGRDAKTIHRLLEAEFGEDKSDGAGIHFQKNEGNPIDAGAVIIDEVSMADILLLSSLLKAVRPGAKLILIGDSDQLPPVGAGDCLRDILSSGAFSFVRLDTIFRQGEGSLIVENAHAINKGEMPNLCAKDKDFFFMQRNDAHDAASVCAELCETRLPKAYGYDALEDIQIIAPSRKGEAGTANLNKLLQGILNPPAKDKKEKTVRDVIFRENDKVMQIKNNYTQQWVTKEGLHGEGVYNGDIGIITNINLREESFTVLYDDKVCVYDLSQSDEIEHAYAVTVHKSQGSEYPCVVIPLVDAPRGLLTRNMLYTAVTRAKGRVIIVGKSEIVSTMVSNNRQSKRYTGLCRMLKAFLNKTE
jgi:exodeoxyribonuclease V alpha subunit